MGEVRSSNWKDIRYGMICSIQVVETLCMANEMKSCFWHFCGGICYNEGWGGGVVEGYRV